MRKISFLIMLAVLTTALPAQENPFPKTITVSGSAEMEIVPDEIYVVVELREYDKKGSGKISLDVIKADFLGFCMRAGLADSAVTIATYEGVNPYWWKRKRKNQDLHASISYQVKFSNSKTMDDLVAILDDDATENFRIVRASHSKISEYRRQLKIQAIKAAKEKATYLAEAINEKAGEAVTINEPGDNLYNNYLNTYLTSNTAYSKAYYADQVKSPQESVDFKSIKLRFEVQVVFALK